MARGSEWCQDHRGPGKLTTTETKVAELRRLKALGLTQPEIAAELRVSLGTVVNYSKRVRGDRRHRALPRRERRGASADRAGPPRLPSLGGSAVMPEDGDLVARADELAKDVGAALIGP